MFWSLTVTLMAMGLFFFYTDGFSPVEQPLLMPLFMFGTSLMTGGFATVYTLTYYKTRVLVGAKGITHVTAFKTVRIAWEEIARWSVENNQGLIESADGTLIRFYPAQFAYGSEIEGLIADNVERVRAKRAKEFPDAVSKGITQATVRVSEPSLARASDTPETLTLSQR
jgi:hypothetical protein